MNRSRWLLAFASLLLVCLPAWAEKPTKDKSDELSKEEKAVLQLVNEQRKKEGLDPLTFNPLLVKAARLHSINQAKQNKLAHELDGKAPSDRVKDVGYEGGFVGENVAMGQHSPAEAMNSWMHSEGHRANILNKDYKEIGIGLATDSRGRIYWTQVFARPK
jgi:uncharacterized protein YkwD